MNCLAECSFCRKMVRDYLVFNNDKFCSEECITEDMIAKDLIGEMTDEELEEYIATNSEDVHIPTDYEEECIKREKHFEY